ncbi:MAG: tRNA preQ1(34) S-adenosylmethionine ribosyltransferase-isomerase QueA [Gammaproteobacteria bacterium]
MQLSDFDFELPPALIAQYPLSQRSASRLLCVNKCSGTLTHRHFTDFPTLLSPLDLLVFNDTQVIKARWYGQKLTGGKIELLIEKILTDRQALAQVKSNKSLKIGQILLLDGEISAEIQEKRQDLCVLHFQNPRPVDELLEQYGHIPLPHYMARADEALDESRYQTVYARHKGAVAAPTAGLHFDAAILKQLEQLGIESTFVTLHVGAGTFKPVKTEDISQHVMHAEYLTVSESVCQQIQATKARGGRVIAVGTTSLRALETAAQTGTIQPYQGDTRLFIYPGYQFNCVDAMITNFHLPKSSLLMLVSALGGYELIQRAYQAAIAAHYRFYSYGDAMWIE